MDLTKLLEQSKTFENEEFATQMQTFADNYTEMNGKVQSLTGDLNKSIQKRESFKEMVKTKFSIDEVSDEALDGAIKGMGQRGTEDLRKALSDNETRYKSDLDAANNRLLGGELDLAIYRTGVLGGIDSQVAKDLVLAELKRNAVIENGTIVYYDNNDLVMKDGKPLNISDRAEGLKSSQDYEFIFKKGVKKGGGKDGHNSGDYKPKVDVAKLTHGEKAKLMKEMGNEAYLKMVQTQLKKGA